MQARMQRETMCQGHLPSIYVVNPGNKDYEHPEEGGHHGIRSPREGCRGSGRMWAPEDSGGEEVVTGGMKGNAEGEIQANSTTKSE